MIKLLKTKHISVVEYSEVTLTPEETELYLQDEEEFLKKYANSLEFKKVDGKTTETEYHRIYTDKTPY